MMEPALKRKILILQAICWLGVTCFVAISFLHAASVFYERIRDHYEPGGLMVMCGNVYTEPVRVILSFLSPIAGAGVCGLALLHFRGFVSRPNLLAAALLTVCMLAAELAYGFWLFRTVLPGAGSLSDLVWWMRPIWKLW
jgi:hypothetical protein